MKKKYLIPQQYLLEQCAEQLICSSPQAQGNTNESYADPQDWGGEWN